MRIELENMFVKKLTSNWSITVLLENLDIQVGMA